MNRRGCEMFFKQLLKAILWSGYPMPKITLPEISLPKITLPKIVLPKMSFKLPTIVIPLTRIGLVLGAINTALLIMIGSLGLLVSYMNPIPAITPYISMGIATRLFDAVVY